MEGIFSAMQFGFTLHPNLVTRRAHLKTRLLMMAALCILPGPSEIQCALSTAKSTRTVSVLALGGDDEDDPDLYPIRLSVDSDFVRTEALSRQNTGISQSIESLILPPTSNVSLNSPCMDTTQLASLKNPTIMHRTTSGNTNVSTGFIEAVDIDRKYRPSAERPPKPSMFFIADSVIYGANAFHSRMLLYRIPGVRRASSRLLPCNLPD